jgi:hypothetical protein
MLTRARVALLGGVALIASCLYVPVSQCARPIEEQCFPDSSYAWVWDTGDRYYPSPDGAVTMHRETRIEFSKLAVEWAAIAGVVLILFFFTRTSSKEGDSDRVVRSLVA